MIFKMLAREELSYAEQSALDALQRHPGWTVVRNKLLPSAVRQASEDLLKIDVAADTTGEKTKMAHTIARLAQDFAAALLRSVEVHSHAVEDNEDPR